MTRQELKLGRTTLRLTQVQAARKLGLSQPYLSQLERGTRPVTSDVVRRAARVLGLSPTVLPVGVEPTTEAGNEERFVSELAALGYPGYAYVRPSDPVNPAGLVLDVLSRNDVDARVTAALTWVLVRYADLDWTWLVSQAKLRDVQNRLGLLVTLARQASTHAHLLEARSRLADAERMLERSRLVTETTLCREAMPLVERRWLRQHRTADAKHWRVLTSLSREYLRYVA